MKKSGILYLIIATLTYGGLQVVDKLALNHKVNTSAYTLSRVFISMLFVGLYIAAQQKHKLSSVFKRQHLKDLVIIGTLASGVGLLFQVVGLSLTTAVNTSIILTFVAPLTSIFAHFLIKEKMPKIFWTASILMIAGSLLVLYQPISKPSRGDLLVFLAVIGYAYSNVYAKRTMKNVSTEVVTFGRLLFGSVSIALVVPFLHVAFSTLTKTPLLVILGGLIFAIRMVAYYKGIALEGAAKAATFLLFSPVVTVTLSYLFLNQKLTINIGVGLFVIIVGGWLLVSTKSKQLS